ncbi:MAG: ABC transporter permease [Ignavibacteriae bacterium]|nr:ABC transporter permease [Ignavibacteriota bacterium]
MSRFAFIGAVMYREFKVRTTSLTWILFDMAVPLFHLLLFGIGLNTAFTTGVAVSGSTVSYSTFFLAGVLSMSGFGLAMNASWGFFSDRDNGIFYEFLTYPMTRGEFLLGKNLFYACFTTVQASITLGIGALLLAIPVRWDMLPLLLAANIVFTAGWFFFLSLFALRIRRNDMYNTIINVLYFVLMFASSMFFPLDNAPGWLRAVALANPLTWSTDTLRHLSVGIGDPDRILLYAGAFLAFSVVGFIAAVRSLRSAA